MAGSDGHRADSSPAAPRVVLSVELILDRAMQLAAVEGLVGVTMRRLADSLGVQAMSLYHHVPNKAALMMLMAERSADQILSDHDTVRSSRWDRQLLALLMGLYQAGVDNPALVDVLAAAPLPVSTSGPSTDRLVEVLRRIRGLLERAPLTEHDLPPAFHGLIGVVIGAWVRATVQRPIPPEQGEDVQTGLMMFLHGIVMTTPAGSRWAEDRTGLISARRRRSFRI